MAEAGRRRGPKGKTRYSIFALLRNALSYHENWQAAWRSPEPKASYDAIVVGGGGHGLAPAYYLAAVHGIRNVRVPEKGWIGGGKPAQNGNAPGREGGAPYDQFSVVAYH